MVPESPGQRTGNIRGFADRAPVSIAAAHRPGTDERVVHHLRVRGFQQARPGQTADHAAGLLAVFRHRLSVQASQWSCRLDRMRSVAVYTGFVLPFFHKMTVRSPKFDG